MNAPTIIAGDLAKKAILLEKLRAELATRVEALDRAPAYRKIDEARHVAAAAAEVLNQQAGFNDLVVMAIAALAAQLRTVVQGSTA